MGGMGRGGGMGGMGGGRRNGGIFGGRGGRGGNRGGNNRNFPGRFPDDDQIRNRVSRANEEAIEYLERMAETTAGRFYEKDVTDLKATFELIADELRKQYRLGYYPKDDESRASVHQIRVKVDMPDVAVRARATYRPKEVK
jgi:VWFA-related protein